MFLESHGRRLIVSAFVPMLLLLLLSVESTAGAAAAPVATESHTHAVPAPPGSAKADFTQARPVLRTEKPGAPVAMSWRLEAAPAIGQPVGVTLDFEALTALSGQVHLAATPGLTLAGERRFELPSRVRGEHFTRRVEVTARDASAQYLHVVVSTTDGNGRRLMRGFAVPVARDQAAVARSEGVLMKAAGGDQVISLPAREERIRPGSH